MNLSAPSVLCISQWQLNVLLRRLAPESYSIRSAPNIIAICVSLLSTQRNEGSSWQKALLDPMEFSIIIYEGLGILESLFYCVSIILNLQSRVQAISGVLYDPNYTMVEACETRGKMLNRKRQNLKEERYRLVQNSFKLRNHALKILSGAT